MIKGKKNQTTTVRRMYGINIIAAVSNKGDLFYTVNLGKTNSQTFGLFLVKLCSHLDGVNTHWRKSTVLMIDNAAYHRGEGILNLM